MAEFKVTDCGSIVMVTPLTEECRMFLENHVDEDAIWFGGALAVEPRYVQPLIDGLALWGFD